MKCGEMALSVLGMRTDPRYFELFGVRFEIPAFEPVRTGSKQVRTVQ